MSQHAVLDGQHGGRGLQMAQGQGVVAHAESQQHVEVHLGPVHQLGLEHGIAHAFRLLRVEQILAREAQLALGQPARLANGGNCFQTLGLEDFRRSRGLAPQADTKEQAQAMVAHGPGKGHDFQNSGAAGHAPAVGQFRVAVPLHPGGLAGEMPDVRLRVGLAALLHQVRVRRRRAVRRMFAARHATEPLFAFEGTGRATGRWGGTVHADALAVVKNAECVRYWPSKSPHWI